MRRLQLILLCVVTAIVAFWLGLVFHFPGETVSRYIEASVNRFGGVAVKLAPAELRWNRLYVATAKLRRTVAPDAAELLTFTDVAIPITWRLFGGLPVSGVIGRSGGIEVFIPWDSGGEAWVEGGIVFEEIPVPQALKPLAVRGRLDFSGTFKTDMAANLSRQIPEGSLRGQGSTLVLSGVTVSGQSLPVTTFEKIEFEVQTGRQVTVRKLTFQGDLQGQVTGTLVPNLARLSSSALSVNLEASFRQGWLSQLGDLQVIAEGFLERGRITATLEGTVGEPRWRRGAGPK